MASKLDLNANMSPLQWLAFLNGACLAISDAIDDGIAGDNEALKLREMANVALRIVEKESHGQ